MFPSDRGSAGGREWNQRDLAAYFESCKSRYEAYATAEDGLCAAYETFIADEEHLGSEQRRQ